MKTIRGIFAIGTTVDTILFKPKPAGYSAEGYLDLGSEALLGPYAELPYANLSRANLTHATLRNASLYYADLTGATLRNATFSFGTTLYDGQTVAQHGFDAAGLQAYLETDPVSTLRADNLTIIPEPTTLLLALLALTAVPLRVRRG